MKMEGSFYKIIDAVPVSIYWKDRNGVYLGCNKYMLEMAGLDDLSEIIGKKDNELPWNNIAEQLFKIDKDVIDNKKTLEIEESPKLASQEVRTFFTTKTPLINDDGSIIGLIGVSVDITELKNTQNKLKKMEGTVDGMMLLSSSMAHELRTPLATINTIALGFEKYLPILISAYQKVKETSEDHLSDNNLALIGDSARRILNSVKSANQFIDMILVNLMLEDKNIAKDEICSIKDCIIASIDEYSFPLGDKDKVDISRVEDFSFYGDSNLIKHIFFNLLKNALYFIEKAGKGTIAIWTDGNVDYNVVYFKDTGMGIAPEKLPKIFDKFFTSDTHHGTGVGLAFCKFVMEGLGGYMTCTSQLGEYTQFVLYFPKARQSNL